MVTETSLNQIVKGAPPPDVKPPPPAPLPLTRSSTDKYTPDPTLASLPSSPPQIYLNLLILESSLRAQYLHLLGRRRLNTFFMLLLGAWNAFFFYALFLRPREDGIGHGGSVYWFVESLEKVFLLGGVVTVLLVWATGQWERGIRWPRRWLYNTNRGLRGFNLRVVIVKGKWYQEWPRHFTFLLPFNLWREAGGSDWHVVEHESGQIAEEDLAKGGDHVLLLLLPKSFSPEFRENWEEYRAEYWERENERRTSLRYKLDVQRRELACNIGGWKWWTGTWRLAPFSPRRRQDLEKQHQHANAHGSHLRPPSRQATGDKANRRRSLLRSDSVSTHSRQSSRSSTPHALFDAADGASEKPMSERVRRGSSVSSTASARRKLRADGSNPGSARNRDSYPGALSPLTASVAVSGNSMSSAGGGETNDEKMERRRTRAERNRVYHLERDPMRDRDLMMSSSKPSTPNADSRSSSPEMQIFTPPASPRGLAVSNSPFGRSKGTEYGLGIKSEPA